MRVSLLFFFFTFSTYALEAPWKFQRPASAPWKSTERAVAREGFFKGLGEKFQRYDSKERNELPAIVEDESAENISSLPWGSHRSQYPREESGSSYVWPVKSGRVTSGFGPRDGRDHEGIDIASDYGDPIRSIADGRVVFSGRMNGYGRIVVVYHGDGLSSVYAHNSKNHVSRGARVKRGQIIAEVGSSGESTGPHVHFELRRDGRAFNPFYFTFHESPYIARR